MELNRRCLDQNVGRSVRQYISLLGRNEKPEHQCELWQKQTSLQWIRMRICRRGHLSDDSARVVFRESEALTIQLPMLAKSHHVTRRLIRFGYDREPQIHDFSSD